MRTAIPKLDRRIKDLEGFDVNTIRDRWDPALDALAKKVNATLREILGHGTVEYDEYSIGSLDTLPMILGDGPYPLGDVIEGYREGIERAVMKLTTLREVFEERIGDSSEGTAQPRPEGQIQTAGRVFVVHGRDGGTKETVARFLSKVNLRPIILHEQPNQGRTIIEKVEAHSAVDLRSCRVYAGRLRVSGRQS